MARLGTYNSTTGKYEKVSNYDVAAAIGAGTVDVGSLCIHPNVNKWSRIKPLALMAAHDTPKELSDSDFANYVEGVYSKPYGLFPKPAIIAKYNVGSMDFTKTTEAELKEQTVWEYSQPKGLNERIVNGEGVEIYARLSDFCGYDHYAKSPISVEWLTENEDGVKGVYARVTLNTNSDTTYGGVMMSDFLDANSSTGGYFVSMLCIANEYINVPELSMDLYRYALGYKNGMSVAFGSSGTTSAIIGVHNGMLSALSGRTCNFIVAVNNVASPEYAISDGWTESQVLHYFPYISNYSSIQNSIIIENAIKRVSLNDITGTTIFLTDGYENKYSELVDLVNIGEIEQTYYEYITVESGLSSFTIKLKQIISSNKRRITFKGREYAVLTGVSDYLTYSQKPGGAFQTGCKPLLKDIPMTNGYSNAEYKADFFLQYSVNSSGNVVVDVVMQVWSTNNNSVVSTTNLNGSTSFDMPVNVLKMVSFSNLINARGNVSGSIFEMFYGYWSVTSETNFERMAIYPEYKGYYPYLPASSSTIDYGDLHFELPDNKKASGSHTLGGELEIDYGIYSADTSHYSLFVRGDKL